MHNNLNTHRRSETYTARFINHRRRRRRRNVIVNREHQEPTLNIYVDILIFITVAFLFASLMYVIYTIMWVLGKDLEIFYKMLIIQILPTYLHFLHSNLVVSCFKTFFVIVITGFLISAFRTVYYSIRIFIVLVRNGDV